MISQETILLIDYKTAKHNFDKAVEYELEASKEVLDASCALDEARRKYEEHIEDKALVT